MRRKIVLLHQGRGVSIEVGTVVPGKSCMVKLLGRESSDRPED